MGDSKPSIVVQQTSQLPLPLEFVSSTKSVVLPDGSTYSEYALTLPPIQGSAYYEDIAEDGTVSKRHVQEPLECTVRTHQQKGGTFLRASIYFPDLHEGNSSSYIRQRILTERIASLDPAGIEPVPLSHDSLSAHGRIFNNYYVLPDDDPKKPFTQLGLESFISEIASKSVKSTPYDTISLSVFAGATMALAAGIYAYIFNHPELSVPIVSILSGLATYIFASGIRNQQLLLAEKNLQQQLLRPENCQGVTALETKIDDSGKSLPTDWRAAQEISILARKLVDLSSGAKGTTLDYQAVKSDVLAEHLQTLAGKQRPKIHRERPGSVCPYCHAGFEVGDEKVFGQYTQRIGPDSPETGPGIVVTDADFHPQCYGEYGSLKIALQEERLAERPREDPKRIAEH